MVSFWKEMCTWLYMVICALIGLCLNKTDKQANRQMHFSWNYFAWPTYSLTLSSFLPHAFFQLWFLLCVRPVAGGFFPYMGQAWYLSFLGQTAFVTTSQPCCCPRKADRWQQDEWAWLWSNEKAALSRGDFCFPGVTRQYLYTSPSPNGQGCCWHLVGAGQGCYSTSCTAQNSPTPNKDLSDPKHP